MKFKLHDMQLEFHEDQYESGKKQGKETKKKEQLCANQNKNNKSNQWLKPLICRVLRCVHDCCALHSVELPTHAVALADAIKFKSNNER